MMTLVDQIVVKKRNPMFEKLDHLCFLSKNLYNATLFRIRQHFFETGQYLGYNKLNQIMIAERNPDYYALPTKVSQQTQRLVDQNFRSFFSLLKKKKSDTSFSRSCRIPKYLPKNGRQVVMYTNQAISTKVEGYVIPSGTDIRIPTKRDKIQFLRITPHGTHITIEVGYRVEIPEKSIGGAIAAIDLGVDNLATLSFSDAEPIIYNGKPVKSVNQFFNKVQAQLRSKQCEGGRNFRLTNRMQTLSTWRYHKLKDYFHKISREIVNQLVSHNVSLLIIGYNKGWKQDTNMGNKTNQKFVSIPHLMLVQMIEYKCELAGIQCVRQEESYTSKCSFLDKEPICKKEKYYGRRVHRGLYKSSTGKKINADVNGSLNIMRKYLNVAMKMNLYDFVDMVEVCSTPSVFTVKR